MLYPDTFLEVLAVQVRATECELTPLPDKDTVAGELVAVLILCFLLLLEQRSRRRSCSDLRPESGAKEAADAETAPVTVAWVTVSLPVPVARSVSVCTLLLPTTTLPKLKLLGIALR
jgi:hypothetical protein